MIRRRFALPLVLSALATFLAAPASHAAAGAAAKPAAAAPGAKPAAGANTASRPAPARTGETRFFLSWNAPYGTPGATDRLEGACGDTTLVDTLYLSFDPGKDVPDFRGASGSVYFHAQEGGTLDDFWKSTGGGLSGSPLRVVFESAPERGFVTPWGVQAAGAPFYDFVSTSGRLRFIYSNARGAGPVLRAGTRYGIARVLVRRPAECGGPICVEWHSLRLAFSLEEERDFNRGERWVSLNSPGGAVCEASRNAVGAAPWRPKGK